MSPTYNAITVSRQFGTGGRAFCGELARRLGWPLFDWEVLSAMAREMRTSEEIVRTYEKMRLESQAYVLTPLSKRYTFLEKDIIGSQRYIASVRKVMLKLVSLGKVIILGRGGQCILHDHPGCLHLRLVAEHSWRLNQLAGRERYASYTQKQLEKALREMESYRAEFTKKHFGLEISDPTLYHLTVNFSLMPPEKALETVVRLAR